MRGVQAALRGRSKVRVGGLAVCGTSGTVLLTDGAGRPMSPALMYDDGRATAQGARARMAGLGVQDTWALPKAVWLTETYGHGRITHQPDLVVSLLTGELPPADSSHALKTGYDLERDAWPAMLSRLGLPDTAIPDVVRPGTRLGQVSTSAAEATGIPAGTPVIAGMTDGCAAQIASAALRPGSWNSVLGTTLVLKGASPTPVRDPTGVVYNHRAPDGSWLPGGASSVGAGVLTAAFSGADPAAMDALAAAYEPAGAITYPLVSPGERFPFLAPDASALVLGEPESDADLWAALLQGVAFTERLCLDYLHHLGAPSTAPSPSRAAPPAARTGTSCAPTSWAARPGCRSRPNRPWGWPRWRRTARVRRRIWRRSRQAWSASARPSNPGPSAPPASPSPTPAWSRS